MIETYGEGKIYLPEGEYTLRDLEDLILIVKQQALEAKKLTENINADS